MGSKCASAQDGLPKPPHPWNPSPCAPFPTTTLGTSILSRYVPPLRRSHVHQPKSSATTSGERE